VEVLTTCGVCGGTGYIRKASGFLQSIAHAHNVKVKGNFYMKSANLVMAMDKRAFMKR